MEETPRSTAQGGSATTTVERGPGHAVGNPVPKPGAAISRYVVLETIGEGGMGIVLRAYDPKLQREVALKRVRRTLDVESKARMLREARAMAKLSHPNVVSVYDVEVVDDTGVVVAMELVRGQTLSTWLETPRSWREVVQRYVEAGRGLLAAHRAGLLHRDFKPGNVLVGDDGRVRVTDFGLARASTSSFEDPASSEHPRPETPSVDEAVTEAGVVMGTRAYMAPEQLAGQSLTAAADQYAYCVALWRGLCGEHPFGMESGFAGFVDVPKWAGPREVPRRVVDALMTGLAIQASERWASMEELLAELDAAVRPRRTRPVLLAVAVGGGIAMLSLIRSGGEPDERCTGATPLVAEAWTQHRAAADAAFGATGRPYADKVFQQSAVALDDYAQHWAETHTEACMATTVRGERSEATMDLQMACLESARIRLRAVAQLFAAADGGVVDEASRVMQSLPTLDRCNDLEALRAGVAPPPEEEAVRVAQIDERLASVRPHLLTAHHDAAETAIDDAVAIADAEPALSYEPARVRIANARGALELQRGRGKEAEVAYRDAFNRAARAGQWAELAKASSALATTIGSHQARPKEVSGYLDLARALAGHVDEPVFSILLSSRVGSVLGALGRHEEAAVEHRKAIDTARKLLGPSHRTVATTIFNYAIELRRAGQMNEALEQHRLAAEIVSNEVSPGHPEALAHRAALVLVQSNAGRTDAALAELREILADGQAALGDGHLKVAELHKYLADLHNARGEFDDAEREYEAALSVFTAVLGADHPLTVQVRIDQGEMLTSAERLEEATSVLGAALAMIMARDPNHDAVGHARVALAAVHWKAGELDDALEEYRAALTWLREHHGETHWRVAMAQANLGAVLAVKGQPSDAAEELSAAIALLASQRDDSDVMLSMFRSELGAVLLSLERPREALAPLEASWPTLRADGVPTERRVNAAYRLGRALWNSGEDRVRARDLVEQAGTWLKGEDRFRETAQDIEQWLAVHGGG